ncbi:MAG: sce7726 family protein [Chloroflexi bacterium]|nr:sce7726 family protein [Chloroflexota bacterium]
MIRQDGIFGDAEIRLALLSRLLEEHADDADTAFIEELGVCRGQTRIDLAVVNGLLHGYEIKSDRDSLRRLNGQVEFYSKVVDRATLVVGGRHLSETLDMIPRWWGALLVTSGPHGLQFKTMRRGRNNPHRDPRSLVELLWLDDAISLLTRRGATRGVRGKPRGIVWDRVCENFDVHEIAATVRAKLKARAAMQGSALLP